MEYVYGPTLRQVFSQVGRKKPVPINHSIRVISDICLGLDHAHKAKGSDGDPLGIVHRDVSPHNIIVSMDGAAKILDFGVAKAHGKLSKTKVGTVKGKFAYMAPEQATEDEADHRADVFAAGICLYRATTGRIPFSGKNELEALSAILDGRYKKPSEVIPEYPVELEDIIRTALEHDREKRFPSARALNDALQEVASSHDLAVNSQALSTWLGTLYPDANETTFDSFEKPKLDQYYLSTPASSGSKSASGLGGVTPTGSAVTSQMTPSGSQVGVMAQQRSPWFVVAIALVAALATVAVGTVAVLLTRDDGGGVTDQAEMAKENDEKQAGNLRAYLDEAERLSEQGKYAVALEVLSKAKDVQTTDSALNLRLARTRDAIERKAYLAMAEQALERDDKVAAVEHAKKVLDRDFENEEALAILKRATARKPEAQPAVAVAMDEPDEPEIDDEPTVKGTKKRSKKKRRRRRGDRADEAVVATGGIKVMTEPPAMVYLDNRPLGRAPLSEADLSPGIYVIEARSQGYEASRKQIEIKEGETTAISIPLVRIVEEKPLTAAEVAEATGGTAVAANTGLPTETKPRTMEPPRVPEPKQPPPPKVEEPVKPPAVKPEAKHDPPKPEAQPRAKPKIASPSLPASYQANSAKQIVEAFRKVEGEMMRTGRLKSTIARNLTAPLAKSLVQKLKPGQSVTIYPSAMYYFAIDRAYEGRSRGQIAGMLKQAHLNGRIRGYSARR